MERHEVENDERLSALIDAARRGDEVVLTQAGEPVATITLTAPLQSRDGDATPSTDNSAAPLILRTRDGGEPSSGLDWEALRRMHESLPLELRGGGATAIRELRDLGY